MTNISESPDKEAMSVMPPSISHLLVQHNTAKMGKQFAAVIRLAMLRDPKHRGCRINKIIFGTRKDKLEWRNQEFRRYQQRYSTF
jgi:hypothetical protein